MKFSKNIVLTFGVVTGLMVLVVAFTNASPAVPPRAGRPSPMSAEKDRQTVERFTRGRAEHHTGDRANNCFNIFRHNSVTGEFIIPAARFQWTRKDDGYQAAENSLTTSGFLKTFPNYQSMEVLNDVKGVLEVALLMHAGSEGALVLFNADFTAAHIVNLYMDNSRVLHLRDFGFDPERNDQLHNSYRWATAILYVNNFPGSNRAAGNPNVIGPNPPDDTLAEGNGTYSPKLRALLAEPMPEVPVAETVVVTPASSESESTDSDSAGE
jgi:hypothetical protein